MKNRMKKPVDSARSHWDAPAEDLQSMADWEASELIEMGRGRGLSATRLLLAVGLEISSANWLRCSPPDQKLIAQSLKCRHWIAAAIAELLLQRDPKQQARIRTFLGKVVFITKRDDASLNGYDIHAFKKVRMLEAAETARSFIPIVSRAKDQLRALRGRQDPDEVLALAANALTKILQRSPLQPNAKIEAEDLVGLRRARPAVYALALAAHAYHLKAAEVRAVLHERDTGDAAE